VDQSSRDPVVRNRGDGCGGGKSETYRPGAAGVDDQGRPYLFDGGLMGVSEHDQVGVWEAGRDIDCPGLTELMSMKNRHRFPRNELR